MVHFWKHVTRQREHRRLLRKSSTSLHTERAETHAGANTTYTIKRVDEEFFTNAQWERERSMRQLAHAEDIAHIQSHKRAKDRTKEPIRLTAKQYAQSVAEVATLTDTPEVVLITPIASASEIRIRTTLNSITEQTYPRWTALLYKNDVPEPLFKRIAMQYAAHTDRLVPADSSAYSLWNTNGMHTYNLRELARKHRDSLLLFLPLYCILREDALCALVRTAEKYADQHVFIGKTGTVNVHEELTTKAALPHHAAMHMDTICNERALALRGSFLEKALLSEEKRYHYHTDLASLLTEFPPLQQEIYMDPHFVHHCIR